MTSRTIVFIIVQSHAWCCTLSKFFFMKNALIHKWASKSRKRFIDREQELLAELIFNLAVFALLWIRELIFDFFYFRFFLTSHIWPSNLLYHGRIFSHLPLCKYFLCFRGENETRKENVQINQVTAWWVRNETLKNNKESFVGSIIVF